MKKALICGIALAFLCSLGLAGMSFAEDKGPADITLEGKKPVVFPHAKHQEQFKCGECHHTKGADGKQAPYTEGMKIEKCDTCHNKDAGMPKGLQSFKDAGHKNCKGCHKEHDKKLTKCSVCHPKKK
jgi:hypothetical protein